MITPVTNSFAGLRFENFNFETELALILNYNSRFLFSNENDREKGYGSRKFFNGELLSCNFTFSKTEEKDERVVKGFHGLVPIFYERNIYFFTKESALSNYALVGRVQTNMFLNSKEMLPVKRRPGKLLRAMDRFWCGRGDIKTKRMRR